MGIRFGLACATAVCVSACYSSDRPGSASNNPDEGFGFDSADASSGTGLDTGAPSTRTGQGSGGPDASAPSAIDGGLWDLDPTTCGDGILDDGEECDGDALDGMNCTGLGWISGVLQCTHLTCQFDTSECVCTGGGRFGYYAPCARDAAMP